MINKSYLNFGLLVKNLIMNSKIKKEAALFAKRPHVCSIHSNGVNKTINLLFN